MPCEDRHGNSTAGGVATKYSGTSRVSDTNRVSEETMSRKINVLLVDDSRTVLARLECVLEEVDDLAIVGMARDRAGAIRMASEAKPDLVLLDIVTPGLGGLLALRTIKSMHPIAIAIANRPEPEEAYGEDA